MQLTINDEPVKPKRTAKSKSPVERLTYRIDEVAEALGVSRRTLERQISAGLFLQADLKIGRMPLWRKDTLHFWLSGQERCKKSTR